MGLNSVVLTAKILVDGAACVVGSIKEVGDFADVGSTKRGEVFFTGLEHFKSRGLMCIFVIREEVRDNSVRDRVNDVEDTSKIGVRVVCEVGGGPVCLVSEMWTRATLLVSGGSNKPAGRT